MMSIKCPGGLGAGPQRGLGQRPSGPSKYIIIISLYIRYIDSGSVSVRASVTLKMNFSYDVYKMPRGSGAGPQLGLAER